MESKRSRMETYLPNGHRASSGASKTHVIKKASELSLTQSQSEEQAVKSTGLKHPLDALSKLSIKQPNLERRSGLQDVDDDYFKQNVFRKPVFSRNTPPSDSSKPNMTTSQAQFQAQQQQQPPPANLTPSQAQESAQTNSAINEKNQINHTLQQNVPQQQGQPQSASSQLQQYQSNSQQHRSLDIGHVPSSNITSTMPEPEMCTTCPHCQTTIYLVRGTDDMSQVTNNISGHHQIPPDDTAAAPAETT